MVTQVTASYADLYKWNNLYTAYRKAAKGKRSRSAAAHFEYRLEDNLIQLQEELAAETYRPGPYNRPRGLPIGNLTSQFWANCYLNSFDHFVNRTLGCSAYLRYDE